MNTGQRWPLRRRVRLLFTAAAVVALASFGVGVVAFQSVLDARERLVDEIDPGLVSLDGYLNGLLAQQNAVRGLLLTELPEFLDGYEAGGEEVERSLRELRSQIGDRPVLAVRIEEIAEAAATWEREFAQAELLAIEGGEEVPARVVQASRAVFDGIRGDVEELKADLQVRRNAARDQLNAATRDLVVALVGAVVALVVVAAVIRVALRRWVTGPLDQLNEDVEDVRAGVLDRPIAVDGPPEIVAVANAVEAMRTRIQQDLMEVTAAREELVETTEELLRSNRDLEQFAYVASHDLQEPLRKVISFSQLLQQRYGDQLDERADQYIAFAVDGAKRMQTLINDLLAFSRVGRLATQMVEVDLGRCVARALDNLTERIEDSGAEVTVADDLPTVEGEPNLLTAVFQNLLGNAIKFRRPDATPQIRVSMSEAPDHWELTVADNGIGIEPEYADRVFVIFQRLHTKDAYTGTGIGLALCRRIIEHHGGQIWVEPTDADGTTIRFTLAKSAAEGGHKPGARARARSDGGQHDDAGVHGLPPAPVGSVLTHDPEGTAR